MPVTKKTKKTVKKSTAKKSKATKVVKKPAKKTVKKVVKKPAPKKVKRISDSPPVVETFVKQEVVEAVVDSSGVVTMVPVVTK